MLTKFIGCSACVLMMAFSISVKAQTTGSETSLKELLERASAQSPFLRSDSAAILIRKAQLEATRYNAIPNFTFNIQGNLGTNNNMPGGYFSYGVVPGNSRVRNEDNFSTIFTDLGIASVNWNFYDFGERKAERKVAGADLDVEQSRFNQQKYNLQAYVIENYLHWMQVEDLLAIQDQNIQRNIEIRQSILALAKSGIRAGVDTSIAEAEISRLRSIYYELNGQKRQYKILLSAFTNTPEDQLKADTAYIKRLTDTGTDGVTDSSAMQHPDMLYYRSVYRNSLEKEALIKKSYYPSLTLQGAFWGRGSSVSADDKFRELSRGLGFERGNYLVGIGITYDVFDIKRKQLKLRTQQAVTHQADSRLKEQELLMGLNERKIDDRLITIKEKLQEIPHQLAAAQAAYRQKLSLYKNGLINIVELNIALSVLYRAETDLITAKYMYCKTLFEKAINNNQVQLLL